MGRFYLFEIRESDGNDCSVFDCIVPAEDQDKAEELVGEHLDAMAKQKGWESDGNFGGYYFPCDCTPPEEPIDNPAECDQCEVLRINGVLCHETGCPTFARYKRELSEFERFEDRECSHGGLNVQCVSEHETEELAENATSRWHSRYEI